MSETDAGIGDPLIELADDCRVFACSVERQGTPWAMGCAKVLRDAADQLAQRAAGIARLRDDFAEALEEPAHEPFIKFCPTCRVDHANEVRLNRTLVLLLKQRLDGILRGSAGGDRSRQEHSHVEE